MNNNWLLIAVSVSTSCGKISEFYPLLVGVSRKRIIGELTHKGNPKDRLSGSIAAAALLAYNGVGILRVHDVGATLDAIKISEAIKRGTI